MGYLIKKHISQVATTDHHRVLFPVGQGGFAFEFIDGFSVVYDCGTITSPTRVFRYIDALAARGIKKINYVVLSHYDKDHVNGVRYLMEEIGIDHVIAPGIPEDLHVVYDIATHHAYTDLRDMLEKVEREVEYVYEEEKTISDPVREFVWEWITKSLLTADDFERLRYNLQAQKIDIVSLKYEDVREIPGLMTRINNVFKKSFGAGGPNAKGLILLSQMVRERSLYDGYIQQGHPTYMNNQNKVEDTSCLYVGDAVLKEDGLPFIKKFLTDRHADNPLCLMQVPHHGSRLNYDNELFTKNITRFYFVCDKDDERIEKAESMYPDLKRDNLFFVRDIGDDLLIQKSCVRK